MIGKVLIFLIIMLAAGILLYKPGAVSEPGPSPQDRSREDLTRIEYPSMAGIPWTPRFIRPQDSLESLYGDDWIYIARFNRIDRRHVYPGMTIKSPKDIASIRNYTPLPYLYDPARRHEKYILINMNEQWIGAYEYGRLKFSMPAATGNDEHKSPTGIFRVDARHRFHTSSLYKTEDEQAQYPMDYAIRFFIGDDNVSYWIHARDLPGRPASHGCIGLFDEAMQERIYGIPDDPVLLDAERLYVWAVGENEYEEDTGELELLEDGPVVEVTGDNPVYNSRSLFSLLTKK
jgi:hypothetical protein